MQTLARREAKHHSDAEQRLATLTPSDPNYLFYRFKLGMRLTAIVVGLKDDDQASYLEQTNLDIERRIRNPAQVLYLREEVSAITMPALRDAIRRDPEVKAAGYCL